MFSYDEIMPKMEEYAYYINKPFPWDKWTILGFYVFLAENGEDLARRYITYEIKGELIDLLSAKAENKKGE